MENIADALFEALRNGDENCLKAVKEAMNEFSERNPRSLQGCKQQPAFRKLWDAMNEAISYIEDVNGQKL